MNQNRSIFQKALELLDKGKGFAFATIIASRGSVPRREGTKMLITAEGETFGSIGGGIMEKEVVELAKKAIKERKLLIEEFRFAESKPKPDEMICGGRLTVLIEPQRAAERLIICGAGHVGYALYQICRPLGFKAIIVDDRPEFATTERFPEAEKIVVAPFSEALEQILFKDEAKPCAHDFNTYFVICTRRHQSDQTCLEFALRTSATFIGMLGSRSKWEQIKKNLRAKGFQPKELERVHSPIGLEIGAVTPEEIAVSIAAELIQHRTQQLAAPEK